MSPYNRTQKSVPRLVTFLPNIITKSRCLFSRPRVSQTDGPSEDLQMGESLTHFQEAFDGPQDLCQATANMLTDDALLDIFDFYLNDNDPDGFQDVDEWHTLVHVCRRWRGLVFASPCHLNLRLLCRRRRPVRAMPDIWPALPIQIEDNWVGTWEMGLDNIIAAFEHPNRVHSIEFRYFPSSPGEPLAAAIQVPFPELTYLELWSDDRSMSALPDSFLGGSAPRLRTLQLIGIPFPALPNLLLSASDLIDLTLTRLPHSGYISPASMVACLSSLNRLKSLSLGFESPRSRPDQPSPPPQPRVVLPALTKLTFAGMAHYSEDFLARIDAPVLDQLSMSFFTLHLNAFDVSRLKQFIGRAKGLEPFKAATVRFQSRSIRLELDQHHRSMLEVRCDNVNWQVDSMARVCSRLSPFLSPIERLDFIADYLHIELQRESTQILDLFRPFYAIRSLHVSRSLVPLIESALRGLIGPRATEVLPNLSDIFLGGPAIPGAVPEAMQPFVISRRLSRRPVAVHHWEGLTAFR